MPNNNNAEDNNTQSMSQDYGTALLFLVALATVLYFSAHHYLEHLRTKKPFANLPMADNSHWFFGHIKILFGAKDEFPQSLYRITHDAADRQGRTGYWLGRKKTMSVLRLDDAKTILKTESHRQPVPIVSRYLAAVVGPKNLLALNGREWRRHRDAVTRTFVPSFLVQAQQDFYQVSQTLVATMLQKIDESSNGSNDSNNNNNNNKQKQYTIDVQPIMKMVTMDIIGKAAFSTEFDCCRHLKPAPVVQAFEWLTNDLTTRMASPAHPANFLFQLPTQRNLKQKEQMHILQSFIGGLLTKAEAAQQQQQQQQQQQRTASTSQEMSSNNNNNNNNSEDVTHDQKGKQRNLLTRLVAAHATMNEANNKNSSSHSKGDIAMDETLRDVMATLLIASYDTTSTTLTFCLYFLAKHPEIQDRCVEEIQSLVGGGGGDSHDDNNAVELSNPDDLVYCTGVVREALRLYPPAYFVSRTLTKPVPLSGDFVAPQGAHIQIPIWVIQHDETIFPHPEEFRPDRWAQRRQQPPTKPIGATNNQSPWVPRSQQLESNESTGTTCTIPAGNLDGILAFSGGGRNCPGAKFAMQEAVIVLANLVKDLQFYLPVPDYQLKLILVGILPYPSGGMPLRIEKRKSRF